VVSGGHSNLIYFSGFNDFNILGTTRDDAPGEAFDKVAKILGLGYPGGPEIDRLAKQVSKSRLHFNCAKLPGTFDFSFSGIKTAVLYFLRDWLKENKPAKKIPHKLKVELAYAFQSAVVEVLVEKAIFACKKLDVLELVVGGGVAANSLLRKKLVEKADFENIKVNFAQKEYCLDNAAMVAGLGYQMRYKLSSHLKEVQS
jgi:N6-L-threonylcarbamoyladenine synthase